MNKLLSLSFEEKKEGVISASTGNHGAAVAYAANQLNIPCTIYVPENASSAKLKNMENYHANINVYGGDCIDSEKKAREKSVHKFTTKRLFSLQSKIRSRHQQQL